MSVAGQLSRLQHMDPQRQGERLCLQRTFVFMILLTPHGEFKCGQISGWGKNFHELIWERHSSVYRPTTSLIPLSKGTKGKKKIESNESYLSWSKKAKASSGVSGFSRGKCYATLGKATAQYLSFFLPCSSSLRGCRSKDPRRRGREPDKAERGTAGDWRRIRGGIPESTVGIVGRVYSLCWWSQMISKAGQTRTTQD